jgi:pimeloyl-ACP methyl ester carboxylesterase
MTDGGEGTLEARRTTARIDAGGRAAEVAVYRAQGARLGTLLFVHGASCDHHAAEPLAEALPDVDVIAPDLPGRGGTPGGPCATPAEAASFVGAVIDALELSSVVVVGHSYGGGIALELALGRPLAGLVLASTGARLRVHPAVLEAMRVQAETSPTSVGLLGWSDGADPQLIARLDAYARAVPSASSLADWRSTNSFDRLGALGAIRTPALVLAGELDVMTPPKYAQRLADELVGSRLELLPGAGHMLPLDQAGRIAPLIRAFMQSQR